MKKLNKKKLILIILCLIVVLSLAVVFSFVACNSKDSSDNKADEPTAENVSNAENNEDAAAAPEYDEKEVIATAKAYIQDKYGFEPTVLNTKNMVITEVLKDARTKTTPIGDIIVEMEHDGKKFSAIVANETGDGLCYDSYQKEEIKNLLAEYIDKNIEYDYDVDITFGYLSYEPSLEGEYMVRNKLEEFEDDVFGVLKDDAFWFSTNVLIKVSEEENVVSDIGNVYLSRFTEELEEYKGQLNIINFKNKEDYDKISYENVFYDGFSDYIMLGLYAKESLVGKRYEDYTLVDTGDFLLSYSGRGETEIINDFTLEDLEDYKNSPDRYENIELVSNAVYVNLKDATPDDLRRVTMYAKLERPEKLVLSNGDDSLYKFQYEFCSTTDEISFGGSEPDLRGEYYVLSTLEDTPEFMAFITKRNNG